VILGIPIVHWLCARCTIFYWHVFRLPIYGLQYSIFGLLGHITNALAIETVPIIYIYIYIYMIVIRTIHIATTEWWVYKIVLLFLIYVGGRYLVFIGISSSGHRVTRPTTVATEWHYNILHSHVLLSKEIHINMALVQHSCAVFVVDQGRGIYYYYCSFIRVHVTI